ncbi:Membrane-bound lytic murein transglycosylase B precursor [Methylophaga frappieri]|uniref:Membrane-bound lytic murein transglycosylase B n=1 Tax=Methylophaga frappieri (strain ATCC BAA-2434 / DSM 25690 / JAM7) TaxID=754477 RepID=I1YHD5_METFJ|nr:lytic murein transglycosylase B [Methylophaga frappieri]AFJ02328.1 Membrane-bound lytic murein transglycosylase B precursor [Methylophaga frappieri]
MKYLIVLSVLGLWLSSAWAEPALPELDEFIDEMVTEHQFDRQELNSLFSQVEVKDSILKAISRPAEKAKPWYEYRNIFLDQARIDAGVRFWQQHAQTLAKAEKEYGVPAEIILAILGVETRFGGNMGSFRVIDALSTLGFRYPPRSPFFRKELQQFLILTREEGMSPAEPVGSYAGAMGLGQFMPSSYRAYAVDFDGDGHRDIWTNRADAIGSIANYLKRHGWQAGEGIVYPTQSKDGTLPEALIERGLKPSISREEAKAAGLSLAKLPASANQLTVFSLTQRDGESLWLGEPNFYAITRYNHSRMYAMAVFQLAEAIRTQYERQQ